ncbi:MAG: YfhO family protein [Firmicutes bacterium]|nr:YfhO family protein [Bacillota bacterium]
MDIFKKNKDIFAALAVVLIAVLAVYALGGIYPFGGGIVYEASNRAALPMYTHMYDTLHGISSPFIAWSEGAGGGVPDGIGRCIGIHTLFLLFAKNGAVLELLSFAVLAAVMLAAAVVSVCVRRAYGLTGIKNIACAVGYALFVFALQHFTSIPLLNTVVFLPLVLLGFRHMARGGNGLWYTLAVAAALLCDTCSAMAMVFYMTVYAFGYMFLGAEKSDRKRFAAAFCLHTLAAVMMSGIAVLPAMFAAAKAQGGQSALDIIKNSPLTGTIIYDGRFAVCGGAAVLVFGMGLAALGFVKKGLPRGGVLAVYAAAMAILPAVAGFCIAGRAQTFDTSGEYRRQMEKLGYAANAQDRLGGTKLTDAILCIDKGGAVLSMGTFVNPDIMYTSFTTKGAKTQNLIYNNFMGGVKQIMTVCKPLRENGADKTYEITAKGECTLYAWTENGMNGAVFKIDGRPVSFDEKYDGNLGGFAELGTLKDEKLTLEVSGAPADTEISLMDNAMLDELVTGYGQGHADMVKTEKNGLVVNAVVDFNSFMFLPVEYSNDWKCRVNGEESEVFPVMNGAFMAISLPKGSNDIRMEYSPRSFHAGIALTIIGLMFAFWIEVRKRENLDWCNAKSVQTVSPILLTAVGAAVIVLMYAVPTIAAIINSIR